MEYIKNQTMQKRSFLLMLALIVIIFKISGSVITAKWSWVGILSVFILLLTACEIYFLNLKEKQITG